MIQSLWNDQEAAEFSSGRLDLRVYTSRLLGREPSLVLHGGGNTSVKITEPDFYGEITELLYVKGSGGDLATIGRDGFAPVRMRALKKMAALDSLNDTDMVRELRAAMTRPDAPTPSIEAILHAVIPFVFVDHTHSDAVVALTNHPDGEARVREVYGNRVIIVPYVMPGFILAKTIYDLIKHRDLRAEGIEGMVLMNHGIFTFHDDARQSYESMIQLVNEADQWLNANAPAGNPTSPLLTQQPDLKKLASLRKAVSQTRGRAQIARLDHAPDAFGYSARPDIDDVAGRGPLTPDHIIRTKQKPVIFDQDPAEAVEKYAADYTAYFHRHATPDLTMLDPAPRVAIWRNNGVVAFGNSAREADIVADIARHTRKTINRAEAVGAWTALPEAELFRMEYWELEQAKLRKSGESNPLEGKIALVTGSAAGIGLACAQALVEAGALVTGFDLNPEIPEIMAGIGAAGVVVNLTNDEDVSAAVEDLVRKAGGLDILISNAGIFTAGQYLEDLDQSNWDKSMAVNLTSHQKLLRQTIPYLKLGVDPSIIFVGSRNVAAPGAGAASYSCAKAALTQLCRVASLELAKDGVRVNILHPDAVFDTKLWTPEALQRSAERYGITVEEYKTRNLMKTEIKSRDVGRMAATMASSVFGKTTGAQIPVDGGNDRVI